MKNNSERKSVKITLTKETRNNLAKFGTKGSTWNDIIKDLLDHCNTCDNYWGSKE